MRKLRELILRFGGLFNKQRKDRELDDELESHLQLHIEENLRSGMTPEEARRQAMLKLGGVESTKEAYRDQRGLPLLETLWRDVRFGARQLRRNPGFTAVAVLTLGLGIGANTAIFSLVHAVALKSLRVSEPDQLFFVTSGNNDTLSYPLIDRLQKCDDIGETFGYRTLKVSLNTGGRNEVAVGQVVSGNYFATLGVTTALGRSVLPSDDRPGAAAVTVISHGCWTRRFGGDPGVLGRTVHLNGVAFTIVGVAPADFRGFDAQAVPEAFVPIRQHVLLNPGDAPLLDEYGSWVFTAVVRLKEGITEEMARSGLTAAYQQVISENSQWIRARDLPEVFARGVRLSPAGHGTTKLREKFARPLFVLLGASALVLLIACANVAGLMLARGTVRARELAVRLAVGASRLQIVRLLLTESLLLASAGCLFGLFLAAWGSDGLVRFLPEEAGEIRSDVGLNRPLLISSVLVSLVAAGLIGIAPAVRLSKAVGNSLAAGGRILANTGAMSRFGKSLVVAQMALSLILLVGAGLFVRTLRELATLDPGFQRENVLLLMVQPELTGYSEADREKLASKLAHQTLLERLEAVPGVRSSSLSSSLEFGGRPWWRIAIRRTDEEVNVENRPTTTMRWVTPKHFETYGIPLLRGRALSAADSFTAPRVVVINETMARQYFNDADPLGKRFKLTSGLEALGEIEIVGVARDTKSTSLRDKPMAMFYLPFAQFPNTENLVFAVRCVGDPIVVGDDVRRVIESLDSNLAVTKVTSLSSLVEASLRQERATATLSTGFGLLALTLAAVGLYGALAYAVGQRTREIGVRMALGAQRQEVLQMIAWQGMKLVGAGIMIGLLGSIGFSRVLIGLLYGIRPIDPLTFASAFVLLSSTAMLACWLPARRATKVDPMAALRYE
jgi:predicted permease